MSVSPFNSTKLGDSSESAVLEARPDLRYVADTEARHYDAEAKTAISASHELPMVGICVIEADQEIEIKSAAARVTADQRRGRFQFRRKQHEKLLEIGGVYLFAVCQPNRTRDVIAMKIVPAVIIDDIVSWIECEGRDDYCQLAWSNIFNLSEVEK